MFTQVGLKYPPSMGIREHGQIENRLIAIIIHHRLVYLCCEFYSVLTKVITSPTHRARSLTQPAIVDYLLSPSFTPLGSGRLRGPYVALDRSDIYI